MTVKYLLKYIYIWVDIDLVDYETKQYIETNYIWPNKYDNWEVKSIQPDGYHTLKVWIKKPQKI